MISTVPTALLGAMLVYIVLWDAFETVLVPRRIGRRVRVTRYFYVSIWFAWRSLARRIENPRRREGFLGLFAPLSQILLLGFWAAALILGFALLQVAALGFAGLPPTPMLTQLYLSGETFFTLGFGDITPVTTFARFLSVFEAGLGFGFLGTAVGYLPTMYQAFSRREIEIALLDARAGSPPTAAEFLRRNWERGARAVEGNCLRDWENWSAQLLETHISYPQLAYYRSQHANQSWLGTLTVILDVSASLIAARDASIRQAEMTFAMARHAMVDITQIFVHRYVPVRTQRLGPEGSARIRELGCDRMETGSSGVEFEERLASLRRMYEPYAMALSAHLLYELPPWINTDVRRDNWQGGPWDRLLVPAATKEPHSSEEHF